MGSCATPTSRTCSISGCDYLAAEQKDIIHLFMVAVSLAIAAVPKGFPPS